MIYRIFAWIALITFMSLSWSHSTADNPHASIFDWMIILLIFISIQASYANSRLRIILTHVRAQQPHDQPGRRPF